MASSLVEDLMCPVCLAFFQEPHMLACGHNFCLDCLCSAVPAGQKEGTCPECRGPFQLQQLKHNRALGKLAMKVRCWKGDEALLPPPPVGLWQWHFCEAHDEPLKLYCTQHDTPICLICRDLPQHRGHEFLPIKDAVHKAKEQLKANLKPLEEHLMETTEDEANQLKEMEALENKTEDLLGHISKEFDALSLILCKKKRDIKLMVEKMKKENMEKMGESLIALKEEVSSRTETITKVKAALETTDHVAFLKNFSEVIARAMEDNNKEESEEESEEESGDDAEEESDQDENGEESSEEEDEDVVALDPALEKFGESLDFELWKEMLESIKPMEAK